LNNEKRLIDLEKRMNIIDKKWKFLNYTLTLFIVITLVILIIESVDF
jgi:hypothetical protein